MNHEQSAFDLQEQWFYNPGTGTSRKGNFLWACLPERRIEKSNWKGGGYMTVYEAFSVLIQAWIFLIALLAYIEMKNTKK